MARIDFEDAPAVVDSALRLAEESPENSGDRKESQFVVRFEPQDPPAPPYGFLVIPVEERGIGLYVVPFHCARLFGVPDRPVRKIPLLLPDSKCREVVVGHREGRVILYRMPEGSFRLLVVILLDEVKAFQVVAVSVR